MGSSICWTLDLPEAEDGAVSSEITCTHYIYGEGGLLIRRVLFCECHATRFIWCVLDF